MPVPYKTLVLSESPECEHIRNRGIHGNKEYLEQIASAVRQLLEDPVQYPYAYTEINELMVSGDAVVVGLLDAEVMERVAKYHTRDRQMYDWCIAWWSKIGQLSQVSQASTKERKQKKSKQKQGRYPAVGQRLKNVQLKALSFEEQAKAKEHYQKFITNSKTQQHVQFFSESSVSLSNTHHYPPTVQQASSQTIEARMQQLDQIRIKVSTQNISEQEAQQCKNIANRFLALKPKSLHKQLSPEYNGDRIWAQQLIETWSNRKGQRIDISGYNPLTVRQHDRYYAQFSKTNPEVYPHASPLKNTLVNNRSTVPNFNEYDSVGNINSNSKQNTIVNVTVANVNASGGNGGSGNVNGNVNASGNGNGNMNMNVNGNMNVNASGNGNGNGNGNGSGSGNGNGSGSGNGSGNMNGGKIGTMKQFHVHDNSFGNLYNNGSFGVHESFGKSRKYGDLQVQDIVPEWVQSQDMFVSQAKKSGRFNATNPTHATNTAYAINPTNSTHAIIPNQLHQRSPYTTEQPTSQMYSTSRKSEQSQIIPVPVPAPVSPPAPIPNRSRPMAQSERPHKYSFYSQTVPYHQNQPYGGSSYTNASADVSARYGYDYSQYALRDNRDPLPIDRGTAGVDSGRMASSERRRPKIFANSLTNSRRQYEQPIGDNLPVFVHGSHRTQQQPAPLPNLQPKRSHSTDTLVLHKNMKNPQRQPQSPHSQTHAPHSQTHAPHNDYQVWPQYPPYNSSDRQTFLSDKHSSDAQQHWTGQFRRQDQRQQGYGDRKSQYFGDSDQGKGKAAKAGKAGKKLSEFSKEKQIRKEKIMGEILAPPQAFLLQPYQQRFSSNRQFNKFRLHCLSPRPSQIHSTQRLQLTLQITTRSSTSAHLVLQYRNKTAHMIKMQTTYRIPKSMRVHQRRKTIRRCWVLEGAQEVEHQFGLEMLEFPLGVAFLGVAEGERETVWVPLPVTLRNYVEFLVCSDKEWLQKWNEWQSAKHFHLTWHLVADPEILSTTLHNCLPYLTRLPSTPHYSTEEVGGFCQQENLNGLQFLLRVAQRVEKIVTIEMLANRCIGNDEDQSDYLVYAIVIWGILFTKLDWQGNV